MKPNVILKQNIPYANLINSALSLCDIMLAHSPILYPFAVISIDKDVQCVFSEHDGQETPQDLIEALEDQLNAQRLMAEDAVGILVYAATISQPDGLEDDALVLNITDSAGCNTITVYPYMHIGRKIELGLPYTCDFSN
ncbi:hypothetical protein [Glaciecola sp. 1036]|uniref:hypothetical protein n=1 Tax=Alteromonadaceae TaxID=72275 RepID=UPI003D04738A